LTTPPTNTYGTVLPRRNRSSHPVPPPQDARRAITDVADDVGVSDDTVRNRIQRPEGEGVIDGYSVDVSYDDADVQHYYVFVCTAHVGEREALAREAGRLPGIVEVRTLMTGTRNVHLTAVGPEKDDITRLAQSIDELGLTIERENLIRSYSRYPFDGFAPDR